MSDPTRILNWRRLTDRITTSGQPSEGQLAEIAQLGVVRVVNLGLHTHERALKDEGATVVGLGMEYVHMPVDFERPTEDDFARFCEEMGRVAEQPVHVHCILNARVSAFFYRYRRDVLGEDDAAALAEMESVWRPGGVWARFIGDPEGDALPHRYAGRDY